MKYQTLFGVLKRKQNLKFLSAANFRWHLKARYCLSFAGRHHLKNKLVVLFGLTLILPIWFGICLLCTPDCLNHGCKCDEPCSDCFQGSHLIWVYIICTLGFQFPKYIDQQMPKQTKIVVNGRKRVNIVSML